jgi:hypothetical protein
MIASVSDSVAAMFSRVPKTTTKRALTVSPLETCLLGVCIVLFALAAWWGRNSLREPTPEMEALLHDADWSPLMIRQSPTNFAPTERPADAPQPTPKSDGR